MTNYRRQTGRAAQTKWEARQREREQRWRKHLAAWKQSALSQAAYCRRRGLPPVAFSWWKHELTRRDQAVRPAAAAQTEPPAASFVPITISAEHVADVICEVVLRNGRRLRVGRDCPPDWLAAAATALEAARSC